MDCKTNFLTKLKFGSGQKIKEIDCSWNQIGELDFADSDFRELTALNLKNNDFPSQDLSLFSNLVGLTELDISSCFVETFKRRNRFCGSLEPLSELTKLKKLDISDTDIDSGLEYLPSSVEKIMIDNDEYNKRENKLKEIQEFLKPYYNPDAQYSYEYEYWEGGFPYYDYQAWRANNSEKIRVAQAERAKNKNAQSVVSSSISLSSSLIKDESTSGKKSKNANKNAKLREAKEQIVQLQVELETLKKSQEWEAKQKDLQIQQLQIELQEERNKVVALQQELANKEREWEQQAQQLEPINRFIGYF